MGVCDQKTTEGILDFFFEQGGMSWIYLSVCLAPTRTAEAALYPSDSQPPTHPSSFQSDRAATCITEHRESQVTDSMPS